MDGVTETNDSTLYAVIEVYLHGNGFHCSTYDDGRTYWGHRELGEGRTFEQAVTWQIGREQEASRAA